MNSSNQTPSPANSTTPVRIPADLRNANLTRLDILSRRWGLTVDELVARALDVVTEANPGPSHEVGL